MNGMNGTGDNCSDEGRGGAGGINGFDDEGRGGAGGINGFSDDGGKGGAGGINGLGGFDNSSSFIFSIARDTSSFSITSGIIFCGFGLCALLPNTNQSIKSCGSSNGLNA